MNRQPRTCGLPLATSRETVPAVSRRAISVDDHQRWVFNRLVDDYARRPGYPPDLVARLLALAGGPGSRVVELGAGMGHLSVPLARAGARVHAVEPASAMLAALVGPAAAAGVTAVHAAGEATGLPAGGFELALLADSLHWVEAGLAGREVGRLLAPGGTVAVVEARLAATPFLVALQTRLAEANPRARPAPPQLEPFFVAAGAGPRSTELFHHEETLEPDRLDAVLRSLSLVGPALGPAALASLLDDARALARRHGSAVWRRELRLHWARRG
jgi:SAM-dependent methyltransferase